METEKKQNSKAGLYIVFAVVVVLVAILSAIFGGVFGFFFSKIMHKKPSFDSNMIQQKISMCSDLTTSTLDYNGEVEFDQGGIKFITAKHFVMEYEAHVEAGIDLSKTEIEVEGTTIYITLPEVELQTVVIDPDSLEFRDESFTLLKWKQHEDVAEALQYAQQDVVEYAEGSRLKESARQQAEDVIRTLLAPIIEEEDETYEIVFR